jgi:Protein of unknown function (DUF5818)
MKRFVLTTILLSGVMAFAQDVPPGNERLFTSDLIAWSFMQQPREPDEGQPRTPTPEPSPETQSPENPTPGTPENPPSAQPNRGRPAAAQSFIGSIAKEADSFVLKVSATTSYKLDNSREVEQFEGQRVRVIGTLDRDINLIHVDKVEPLF